MRNDVYDIVPTRQYITFTATKIILPATEVTGYLKILDKMKKVTLKGKVAMASGHLVFNLNGKIIRQDYGLNWEKPGTSNLKKLAAKTVGDTVKLSINILAKAKKIAKSIKK